MYSSLQPDSLLRELLRCYAGRVLSGMCNASVWCPSVCLSVPSDVNVARIERILILTHQAEAHDADNVRFGPRTDTIVCTAK